MLSRDNLPTSLPFFLRSPRAEVHRQLGPPDRTFESLGQQGETFFDVGLAIQYDDNDAVTEIRAFRFHDPQGKTGYFVGSILGVSLGESQESYSAKLMEPDHVKEWSTGTKDLTWAIEDFFLQLEVTTTAMSWEPWGNFVPGDVMSIELTANTPLLSPAEIREKAARVIQEDLFPGLPLDVIKRGLEEMESEQNDPKSSSEQTSPLRSEKLTGADQNSGDCMADLPDWIVKAIIADRANDGMFQLGFYGDRRIDDIRAKELLAELMNLNCLQNLKSLLVTESPMSDTSFIEWGKAAQAGKLKRLQSIGFGGTLMSDKSSIEWAKAAQYGMLKDLKALQLFNTKVSDHSMIEWARAAQAGNLTNLDELWLIETSLSDESMTAWAKAAQAGYLIKLERLALFETQVGEESLAAWAEAADAGKLPNLITFWLQDTKVSTYNIDGRRVEIPWEYLGFGNAQCLFEWIREQRK